MGDGVTVERTENEAFKKHHPSAAVSLISRDIARMTKFNRVYVALCMIACVSVLGLLLARLLLLK